MPGGSGKERRRYKRVIVRLPATVRVDGGTENAAEVLNISVGGALVSCPMPIAAVGQFMYLNIQFSNVLLELKAKVSDRGEVELDLSEEDELDKSVIRWVSGGRDGNFGVQFVDMRPEKMLYLEKLIEYLAEKHGWDE